MEPEEARPAPPHESGSGRREPRYKPKRQQGPAHRSEQRRAVCAAPAKVPRKFDVWAEVVTAGGAQVRRRYRAPEDGVYFVVAALGGCASVERAEIEVNERPYCGAAGGAPALTLRTTLALKEGDAVAVALRGDACELKTARLYVSITR